MSWVSWLQAFGQFFQKLVALNPVFELGLPLQSLAQLQQRRFLVALLGGDPSQLELAFARAVAGFAGQFECFEGFGVFALIAINHGLQAQSRGILRVLAEIGVQGFLSRLELTVEQLSPDLEQLGPGPVRLLFEQSGHLRLGEGRIQLELQLQTSQAGLGIGFEALTGVEILERGLELARLPVQVGPLEVQSGFGPEGDGFVEIQEIRKAGGVAIGIASDEERRQGINAWKRGRLIEAGADVIIGDYRCLDLLFEFLQIP